MNFCAKFSSKASCTQCYKKLLRNSTSDSHRDHRKIRNAPGHADVILTLVLVWLRIHSGDSDKETYSTVYSEVHQSQISMAHM